MSDSTLTPVSSQLSRRHFLEATSAAGAMGMVGTSLLSFGAAAAVPPPGSVLTGSHWGAFRAKVEGGRVVGFTPWEKDPFPSPQLKGVIDSIYSASRIKYPMVRRSYLEKGPGTDNANRGNDRGNDRNGGGASSFADNVPAFLQRPVRPAKAASE